MKEDSDLKDLGRDFLGTRVVTGGALKGMENMDDVTPRFQTDLLALLPS